MKGFFKGTATAMVTPFTEDGVDLTEFGKMIDFQIKNGTDALVILGTTGEPATMTEQEKIDVMKFSVAHAKGRIKIIFGTGSNSTAHAVDQSKLAEELGADGILVVTPYYNKCTQRGILEYYQAVCSAVSIPVIAYNVPGRTGVNILPATAEKLSYIPNLAGIKEACGNMSQICETARRIRERTDVFSGDDGLNLPIYAIGGAGCISVASNVAPAEVKEIYTLFTEGKMAEALDLHDKLLPMMNDLFIEVNPIPVKEACNMIGFKVGSPRSPLTKLEDEHKEILKASMQKAGVLS